MRRFIFELQEGALSALRAVRLNKMRSMLTTLGVVIGIVTITVMVTVINSIESGFDEMMSSLGADVLYVQRMPAIPDFSKMYEYFNRPDIQIDLIDAINERSRYAEVVAPWVKTGRIAEYEGRTMYGVDVVGSSAALPRIRTLRLEEGRFYSAMENRANRYVTVIGSEIAEELFPRGRAIGKAIKISGRHFRVIGVMESSGGMDDTDETAHIPFETFTSLFGSYRSIQVMVKAPSPQQVSRTKDELTGIVRVARGVAPMEENNFAIIEQAALKDQLGGMLLIIYVIGLFLTGLALLVGGIGVMNIMFVSVKERTREIGLRKAVGAPRRAILTQFLLESVIICSIGGAIGTLLAYGGTSLLNATADTSVPFSPGTVVMAMALCAGVGVLFGLAPAWTATKAEPVESLRYE